MPGVDADPGWTTAGPAGERERAEAPRAADRVDEQLDEQREQKTRNRPTDVCERARTNVEA
jgi:hypothetical protein